ncbi:hypothetical protein IFM89_021652 [Coptis chinensis]|uniref:Lipoxygenase n=1 Tax=Coptis chinensis TaxID=261450 RepID=A0A835ICM3_9MAGN|nr:hypothetical protein IFM89_021652 [Coptis chinensis]
MAGVKEMMGCSLSFEKTALLPSSRFLLNSHNYKFHLSPGFEKRSMSVKKVGTTPVVVAAISEDLVRALIPEKSVKFKVRAVVTIRKKNKEDLKETIVKHFDALTDKIGRNVVLELISTEINPRSKTPKKSNEAVLKDWLKKLNIRAERVTYSAEFLIDSNFGMPGAIAVTNKHQKEFFLESIVVEGLACGPVHFSCNSWVQSKKDHPGKRIFFSNKPYLPSETPAGLKELREKELSDLRGDGQGERKPKLGGEAIPFPRRCRTGRSPTDTDINAESRVEKPLPMYVPRDEAFEESKQDTFATWRLKGVLHNLIPSLIASISADNHDFKGFSDIDSLYKEGLVLNFGFKDEMNKLPKIVNQIRESSQGLLKYDTPRIISRDKFAWLRDDEFARQAIAGINPVNIKRLEVFPPVSELDPTIYGPQESALKEEHIIGHINGMSVVKLMEPVTLFFLTPLGTLKPIAIELSLPQTSHGPQSKRVLTPAVCATTNWLWQLAKAHVCANDAGVHQLVNHWLRTHACLEPFILAAHRRMSAMHPIFKLLDPHMRYTLEINALARQSLINAGGVIESCFTPGEYCMDMSAVAYKEHWRFDQEGLPADLIQRGIAIPDPTQPHGLKLLLEDYPYATDGLLIWHAIEKWVETYVNHYYPDPSLIQNDSELLAWYAESINVGHADIRCASWWPQLSNADDLISILTTLIWLASAQHAALNFGQYPYGGYVPNRPPLMRRLIPDESDPEYANLVADPKPSTWSGDHKIVEAFYNFSAEINKIEKEIERRNSDPKLRNRCGAGFYHTNYSPLALNQE